ncbi:hypothetical protein GCM10022251_31620 [Phytohabitans flavus]|uniref:MaoC-like domain-containing protein n=1 Tax=Phytohabitans flavus TaxID=1076124 RepID=A0A6F8XWQ3_9ACTN|nr:MaoC family dehydratase N-terminal domain-containing protein [Phytohabitans flavus]BCB78240.1 hypothetical protein Pflav_046500 [Phytohabitans flavus]
MRVSEAIPTLTVDAATLEHVVRWSAAIDDYTPIHFDPEAAAARGMAGPVVNGPWKAALLATMLESWLDGRGTLARLDCRYRRPDLVGAALTFGGTVTAVTAATGHDVVECDVWVAGADGDKTVTGTATVHLRPASTDEETLATERLKAAVRLGQEAGRFTYEVTAGDIARFRAAVGDPGPDTVAPLTFFAALDPVERRDMLLDAEVLDEIPFAKTGGGNAFNEVEYERPIRAGDVITVVTSYTEVYERDGGSGRLLFRVRTNDLLDAAGDLVARTRMGHVMAYDLKRRVKA